MEEENHEVLKKAIEENLELLKESQDTFDKVMEITTILNNESEGDE